MLKLVADLRNHPCNIFMAEGLPVTLSPDDPSIYGTSFVRPPTCAYSRAPGYTGVSYDYYEAFMAWDLGLKGLKQLTMNSLIYSALDTATKQTQLAQLQRQWDAWIDAVFNEYLV